MRRFVFGLAVVVLAIAAFSTPAGGQLWPGNASKVLTRPTLPLNCEPRNGQIVYLQTGNRGIYSCTELNTWTRIDTSGYFNVKAFGAIGNGAADDTAAIQAAINAAGLAGGVVYAPHGTYRLAGAGAQLLLIESRVSIVGDGPGVTIFLVANTVGGATDAIRVHAPLGADLQFTVMRDFQVVGEGPGAPGRAGIVIDTTDQGIAYVTYERLVVLNLGGRGFVTINPALMDGFFLATVRDCRFERGLFLERAGDSVTVDHCNMHGPGIGIEASMVVGANSLILSQNNITSYGPAIRIHGAGQVSLRENQLEAVPGGNYPAQPIVDVIGAVGNVVALSVVDNNINPAVVANTDAMHLDWTSASTIISGNRITLAGAGVALTVTGNTLAYTFIGIPTTGGITITSVLQAALGAPPNGTVVYCSDCTNASNPCAGAGTGAIAKRLNGAWDCR